MADQTIYGCFDAETGRILFKDGCCEYPGCFVADRSDPHFGQVKVRDPGSCTGDYYACFRADLALIGRWSLTLPDSCCYGVAWKIDKQADKPYMVWLKGISHSAHDVALYGNNILFAVNAESWQDPPHSCLYELTPDGDVVRSYSIGSDIDGTGLYVFGASVFLAHTGVANVVARSLLPSGGGFSLLQTFSSYGTSPTGADILMDADGYVWGATSGEYIYSKWEDYGDLICNSGVLNGTGYALVEYGEHIYLGTGYNFNGDLAVLCQIYKNDTNACEVANYWDGPSWFGTNRFFDLIRDTDGYWYAACSHAPDGWSVIKIDGSNFWPLWQTDLGANCYAVAADNNYIYVGGYPNNTWPSSEGKYASLWKLDKDDGSVVAWFNTCSQVNAIAVSGDFLYLAGGEMSDVFAN